MRRRDLLIQSLLARMLVLGPGVIASSTPGALAKDATQTVPVVFVAVGDPAGSGVVAALARPSGNITGVTNSSVELPGKRLALLKEILPAVKRIAVFVNPNDANAGLQIRCTEVAVVNLGLDLLLLQAITNMADLVTAFASAVKAGAQTGFRLVDPLSSSLRQRTSDLSLRYRLPVIYAFREGAAAGGLASYGTSQADVYRRAASFVHRILSGAPPGEIPVEQSRRFELVINLKAAKALGISLPQTVLARADEVIE